MNTTTGGRLTAALNDLFLFMMMLTIAAILTVAMVLQYYGGEIPCPLCLLQRVAMFGVCFGIVLHFRHGYSARNDGLSLLFALLLLILSARQTLLDISPRPGHSYVGSAILGLHMPVWSVVIAVAILLAFAIKFAVLGDGRRDPQPSPALGRLARLLSLYVIAICLVNFASVLVSAASTPATRPDTDCWAPDEAKTTGLDRLPNETPATPIGGGDGGRGVALPPGSLPPEMFPRLSRRDSNVIAAMAAQKAAQTNGLSNWA